MSDELQQLDLHLYVDAICARFFPADRDDATHFFSTEEVLAAIKSQNPDLKGLSCTVVHDSLTEAGFRLGMHRGSQSMTFLWMMKEK
ncbi:5-formyltetrahydrofolate cyclo-ligase [Porphyromonas gingivalis]|uniref:Uncharacterized protein n=2 Tax=Nixviridae TaxID=3424665 RepID=A0AAT9JDY4_9CAUD|nr:5-formyltetrahydrofolate cyclo-ligase [Porphyromonas gingivalis]ATR90089.1 5-formyltetrahydrofolate cyclo-ligase [Porphyromonas gingivalis]OWR80756.1 hypothetical protein SJDPG11_03210 [Porphyromonas gingivalis SJD11]